MRACGRILSVLDATRRPEKSMRERKTVASALVDGFTMANPLFRYGRITAKPLNFNAAGTAEVWTLVTICVDGRTQIGWGPTGALMTATSPLPRLLHLQSHISP